MSVCIVAKFPWQSIREQGVTEPHCVTVLTDTRISASRQQTFGGYKLSKQRRYSENLIICYTSSHVFATTDILDRIEGTPTTKGEGSYSTEHDIVKIGRYLKHYHKQDGGLTQLKHYQKQYGGLTQLIAVLWQKNDKVPRVFEVTPPDYKPINKAGIVGIGQRDVLERFQELFTDPPLTLNPHEQQVQAKLTAALSQAIEEINNFTVALPLEISLMQDRKIIQLHSRIRRSNTEKWERITANDRETFFPSNQAINTNLPSYTCKALQLFK